MELIEKALAKARKQQESGRSRMVRAPAVPAPEETSAPNPVSIDRIEYTQTRVEESAAQSWARSRLVAADSHGAIADVFRMLRTKVLQQMRDKGWRTLAIAGATPGVGKSTVAANLALSMALDANQTVLLVDADMRKPQVASYLGIHAEYGLGDYLTSDVPLEQVLVNPGIPRLVVLPGKGSYANSAELLASKKMLALVDELRNRYDSRMVVFDLPPLLRTSDALAFMPHFDCSVLVVEDGGNTAEDLVESQRLLQNTNFLGWVLNKAAKLPGGYYY